MLRIPLFSRSERRRVLTSRARILLAAASLLAALAEPAAARTRCDLTFQAAGLAENVLIGFADLEVAYARPKIFPPDETGRVVCYGIPASAAAGAKNRFDSASEGTMTVAFASEAGAAAGLPAFRCEVYAAGTSNAVLADFPGITTLQARDSMLAPILPLPSFSITEIRCGDSIPTTTTSTTTTTWLDSSTTTTTLEPEICTVALTLASGANVRRVRFDFDYSQAGGHLAGGPAAACRGPLGTGVSVVPGDLPGTLTFDLVSPSALKGPRDLIVCDFVPTAMVAAGTDFQVTVLRASDANGVPMVGLPGVSASDVFCASLTTSTSTSTTVSTTTTLPFGTCGDANGNGTIEASDALVTLKAAVGLPSPCTFTPRCDVDSSGGPPTASDALRILRASVGQDVLLVCPG